MNRGLGALLALVVAGCAGGDISDQPESYGPGQLANGERYELEWSCEGSCAELPGFTELWSLEIIEGQEGYSVVYNDEFQVPATPIAASPNGGELETCLRAATDEANGAAVLFCSAPQGVTGYVVRPDSSWTATGYLVALSTTPPKAKSNEPTPDCEVQVGTPNYGEYFCTDYYCWADPTMHSQDYRDLGCAVAAQECSFGGAETVKCPYASGGVCEILGEKWPCL